VPSVCDLLFVIAHAASNCSWAFVADMSSTSLGSTPVSSTVSIGGLSRLDKIKRMFLTAVSTTDSDGSLSCVGADSSAPASAASFSPVTAAMWAAASDSAASSVTEISTSIPCRVQIWRPMGTGPPVARMWTGWNPVEPPSSSSSFCSGSNCALRTQRWLGTWRYRCSPVFGLS